MMGLGIFGAPHPDVHLHHADDGVHLQGAVAPRSTERTDTNRTEGGSYEEERLESWWVSWLLLLAWPRPPWRRSPGGRSGRQEHVAVRRAPRSSSASRRSAGAFGQATAIAAACTSIGRNPGAVGPIRITMIIGVAFIESLVIYALLIAFMIL